MTIKELIKTLMDLEEDLPDGGSTRVVFRTDRGTDHGFTVDDNIDEVIIDGEQYGDVKAVIMSD